MQVSKLTPDELSPDMKSFVEAILRADSDWKWKVVLIGKYKGKPFEEQGLSNSFTNITIAISMNITSISISIIIIIIINNNNNNIIIIIILINF